MIEALFMFALKFAIGWYSGRLFGMLMYRPRMLAARALFVLGDLIGAIGTQLFWLAQGLLAISLVLMRDASRVARRWRQP